jgi:hypothetical protein
VMVLDLADRCAGGFSFDEQTSKDSRNPIATIAHVADRDPPRPQIANYLNRIAARKSPPRVSANGL